MAEWQPIETAPKDGSHILVSCQYEGGERRSYVVVWVKPFKGDGYWGDTDEFDPMWHQRPSHWMPLPEPPLSLTGTPARTTSHSPEVSALPSPAKVDPER